MASAPPFNQRAIAVNITTDKVNKRKEERKKGREGGREGGREERMKERKKENTEKIGHAEMEKSNNFTLPRYQNKNAVLPP